MTLKMIDVSSNNHPNDQPIDWARVKAAGVGAVMVKATEGLSYINPWLDRDGNGAHSEGIHVGYYHFARPGQGNVNGQANSFWQHIKDLPRDIGVALDLEVAEGRSWRYLNNFGESFLGRLPGEVKQRALYSNASWLSSLSGAPWGYSLWIASWGVSPRRDYWAWQQTGSGSVDGVEGSVDISVVNI